MTSYVTFWYILPRFTLEEYPLSDSMHATLTDPFCSVAAAKSGPAGNHCPLCHQNTPPYDSGFRQHLLEDCKANCRNPHGEGRQAAESQMVREGKLLKPER